MKQTPPLSIYKKIATLFVVMTVGLVAFLLYYSLTYAYISVTPKPTSLSYDFNAVVTQNDELVDPTKGVFKGETRTTTIEKTATFATTGSKKVVANATGKVTLINNNSREQTLIATTRLLTSKNELLRIKDTVTVPAGGRSEVAYYQDNESASIALEIGQKLTIPGLSQALQEVIYAQVTVLNEGVETQVAYVSQEDHDKALASIMDEVKNDISSKTPAGFSSIINASITDKNYSKKVQDDADEFTLTVKADIIEVLIPTKEATAFAQGLLESNISLDHELYSQAGFGITYTFDSYDEVKKLAQVSGVVSSSSIIRPQASMLNKQKLAGLTKEEVVAYLQASSDVESVEVKFFPFWIKTVPNLSDHIIVTINTSTQE